MIQGWLRSDGRKGIRNVVAVAYLVECAHHVARRIVDKADDPDVQLIGFDPWNARKLVTDLQKAGADPDLFVEMRQGIPTLGEPTKQFERLVYAGLLEHGGHPVLRWMAGNTVVRFDENMNFAPAKKKSGSAATRTSRTANCLRVSAT